MGGRRSRAASNPIRRAPTKAMAMVAISVVPLGIVAKNLERGTPTGGAKRRRGSNHMDTRSSDRRCVAPLGGDLPQVTAQIATLLTDWSPSCSCTPSMRIEDYALIGDCETGALIGRDGSIDWLCWPRFDSGACFAALLGNPEHGRWKIAPASKVVKTSRTYRADTLILETRFETSEGVVLLTDFMPLRGTYSDVVRRVTG